MRWRVKIIREPKGKPYIMLRRGIGPVYAGRRGRLLLKTEVRWWHWCGFWINSNRGCWWVYLWHSF